MSSGSIGESGGLKAPKTEGSAQPTGVQAASLRRIKMLADIDERLLTSMLAYLEVVEVPVFATVVTKGERGDALFMVLEGELRARNLVGGRETTLAIMAAGECFGEMAVLDQSPRAADVIANQPSVLVKLSDTALKKIFAEARALAAPPAGAHASHCGAGQGDHKTLRGFDPFFTDGWDYESVKGATAIFRRFISL